MEKPPSQPPQDPRELERARASRIADEAEKLAATWKYPNNIYKALDKEAINDEEGRRKWIARVERELGRREKRRREVMMRDAAKHEREHGPGPETEEES